MLEALKLTFQLTFSTGKHHLNSDIHCFLIYAEFVHFCNLSSYSPLSKYLDSSHKGFAWILWVAKNKQVLKLLSVTTEDIWGNNRWLSAYIANNFNTTSYSQSSARGRGAGRKKGLFSVEENILRQSSRRQLCAQMGNTVPGDKALKTRHQVY